MELNFENLQKECKKNEEDNKQNNKEVVDFFKVFKTFETKMDKKVLSFEDKTTRLNDGILDIKKEILIINKKAEEEIKNNNFDKILERFDNKINEFNLKNNKDQENLRKVLNFELESKIMEFKIEFDHKFDE